MRTETAFPKTVIASLVGRTKCYLADEIGIEVTAVQEVIGALDSLKLKEFTAIIGVGGGLGLLIAFSFPRKLVDILYERLTADIQVPPGEEALYRGSTVAEVANIIIGNCTADFAGHGEQVSISPPVLLEGTKQIHRLKDAMFDCISMVTAHGCFDIDLVGPHEMFDARLEYVSEA